MQDSLQSVVKSQSESGDVNRFANLTSKFVPVIPWTLNTGAGFPPTEELAKYDVEHKQDGSIALVERDVTTASGGISATMPVALGSICAIEIYQN